MNEQTVAGVDRRDRTTYKEPTIEPPEPAKLMRDELSYGQVEATDGCMVEPDGQCVHGHVSWLLYWGMV